MDALSFPEHVQLALVAGPKAARPQMLALAARLALVGPAPTSIRVLDGGNSFNAYAVARALRAYTPRVEPVLDSIQVQRAFTCYQMLTLLQETPPDPAPTLVLDVLSTFQDENVHLAERRRLLGECILRLRALSQAGLVVVSARLPDQGAGAAGLFALLEAACDGHLFSPDPPAAPEPPLLPGF